MAKLVKTKAAKQPKKTRADKSAERRELATQIRHSMRDRRGTHQPAQTRPITTEDVEQIIDAVADGDTVIGMCRELGLSRQQFMRHLLKDDEARLKYERAIPRKADSMADDIEDVASAPIDPMVHALGGGQAEIAHRALLINTKKWLMGKYNSRYSDRTTTVLEGNAAAPVVTKDVTEMGVQEMIQELQARHRRPRG